MNRRSTFVAAGIAVFVASQGKREKSELTLSLTGLRGLFGADAVFSAHSVARGKPHPDLFLLAAERLGVDPTRCVVLEDSEPGVTAANAAGCVTVGVPAGMTADAAFAHADLVVPSVAELSLERLAGLFG